MEAEELYMEKGSLIPEELWQKRIDEIRASIVPVAAVSRASLAKAIEDAVVKRAPKSYFGVMFSGGLDSSLISHIFMKKGLRFKAYSVAVGDSHDALASLSAANLLKLDHVLQKLSNDEAKEIIKKVALLLKDSNPVNVGVGCVTYSVCRKASSDGIKKLFSGLGAEEIFAGYERHRQAKDINEECWKGLASVFSRDIVRDFAIASHFGISLRTPFLDRGLIAAAMSVPGNEKYDGKVEKLAEREAAIILGLPEEIAGRKKKAAQYGTNFDKLIGSLAKKAGFKTKREYLASLIGL